MRKKLIIKRNEIHRQLMIQKVMEIQGSDPIAAQIKKKKILAYVRAVQKRGYPSRIRRIVPSLCYEDAEGLAPIYLPGKKAK